MRANAAQPPPGKTQSAPASSLNKPPPASVNLATFAMSRDWRNPACRQINMNTIHLATTFLLLNSCWWFPINNLIYSYMRKKKVNQLIFFRLRVMAVPYLRREIFQNTSDTSKDGYLTMVSIGDQVFFFLWWKQCEKKFYPNEAQDTEGAMEARRFRVDKWRYEATSRPGKRRHMGTTSPISGIAEECGSLLPQGVPHMNVKDDSSFSQCKPE